MKRNSKQAASFALLSLLLLGSLIGLGEWEAGIDEEQAEAIAVERMAGIAISGFAVKCSRERLPGYPGRAWRVVFLPRDAQEIKCYAVELDFVSGEIIAFGWEKRYGAGWDRPGYRTPDKEKEAHARAEAEVCAFFGIEPEALNALYAPEVGDALYQGVSCYRIDWLPKDESWQSGHYRALVAAELGTVVEIYYSSVPLG